jgi:predicted nucleic acid-binding protein
MGALSVPPSGMVYVDTGTVIYTVERYPACWPLLEPLWQAGHGGTIEIVSSELALMETLVGPLKSGDMHLKNAFEQALLGTEVRLLPITQPVLRGAAQLRATTKLRTPDAVHAATGLHAACVQFVSNDVGFRAVPGLPLVILDDLLKP